MRVQHLQPIFPVLLPFQLDAFNLFIPNNFIHPSLLVSALSLSPELSLVDFEFNNFLYLLTIFKHKDGSTCTLL